MSSILKESYIEANRIIKEWNPTAYDRAEHSAIQIKSSQLQDFVHKELQNARDQKWNAINFSLKSNDEAYEPPKCINKYCIIIYQADLNLKH